MVAAIHFYWGLGGLWPVNSHRELVDTVIGDANLNHVPGIAMTGPIAVGIFAAGITALGGAGIITAMPTWFWKTGCAILVLVFAGRGLAGFAAAANLIPINATEPFATYDVWAYSPLCIAIGTGFAIILMRNGTLDQIAN